MDRPGSCPIFIELEVILRQPVAAGIAGPSRRGGCASEKGCNLRFFGVVSCFKGDLNGLPRRIAPCLEGHGLGRVNHIPLSARDS